MRGIPCHAFGNNLQALNGKIAAVGSWDSNGNSKIDIFRVPATKLWVQDFVRWSTGGSIRVVCTPGVSVLVSLYIRHACLHAGAAICILLLSGVGSNILRSE